MNLSGPCRRAVAAMFLFGLATYACTASEATPGLTTSVSTPPSSHPTASASLRGNPIPSVDWALSGLQSPAPWHGRILAELPTPAGNGSAELIGIGADDTVYVSIVDMPGQTDPACAERCLRIMAFRPDGSTKPGWPSSGLAIEGYPIAWAMNAAGTTFVRTESREDRAAGREVHSVTITAIGPDGRILPGWPYAAPMAPISFSETLAAGPDNSACFIQNKAGDGSAAGSPEQIYCVDADGRLRTGWPYTGVAGISQVVIGPTGTVFAAEDVSAEDADPFSRTYRAVALGRDGKMLPGWPWMQPAAASLFGIVPRADGGAVMLVGQAELKAGFDVVDASGRVVAERRESEGGISKPIYYDVALASDSRLFVAAQTANVGTGFLNAYDASGGQLAGWPRPLSYWTNLTAGRSEVWSFTNTPAGRPTATIVTAFDFNGRLRPGFPMVADLLRKSRSGFSTGSDGTLFAVSYNPTVKSLALVAIEP